MEWLKTNTAARRLHHRELQARRGVIIRRNEAWKADGKLPFFRRIILQTVPEPATRANLIERGDADLSIDLAASDMPTMEQAGQGQGRLDPADQRLHPHHHEHAMAPFDNVKVRQAVAAALPYDDMFKAAIFGRGAQAVRRRWTGTPPERSSPADAVPHRPRRAKQLLAEAGMPNGFNRRPSPSAPARLGHRRTDGGAGEGVAGQGRHPGGHPEEAGCRVQHAMESDKKLPFYTDGATAWLPATRTTIFYLYFTRDQRWNFASLEEHRHRGAVAGRPFPDRPGEIR